jgi:hypothetical protein
MLFMPFGCSPHITSHELRATLKSCSYAAAALTDEDDVTRGCGRLLFSQVLGTALIAPTAMADRSYGRKLPKKLVF